MKSYIKIKSRDMMLKEKPLKLLFEMGFPAVIMALMDELNSFIDAAFMGRYFGSEAVSSMSVILPVLLFMVAFSMVFSEGASTAIGRYLGSEDIPKADEYFSTTVVITFISGVISGVILYLALPELLKFFDAAERVKYFAEVYLKVLSLGMPVFMMVMVLAKMLYTEGKNTFLLITSLIQLISNIIINYILLGVLKIGVTGAALGTLTAELLQIIILMRYINSERMTLNFKWRNIRISGKYLREVLALGIPVFISMVLLSMTLGIESRVIAGFGSEALSIQTITGYVFSVSSSVASGLMGVSLVILSYSVGAGKIKRFFQVIKVSAFVIFMVVTCISLILVINSDLVVRIFTDSRDVMELIRLPALVYGVTAPFIFTTNVVLYAMQPVGMGKYSTLLFASQQMIVFLPLLFILKNLGFFYAIAAQPLAGVAGGVATVFLLPAFIRNTKVYIRQKGR